MPVPKARRCRAVRCRRYCHCGHRY